MELSGDNYNLPAYFGNLRWTYYRMRTEGQNTLLLNGENQDPKAAAPILAFQSTKDTGYAVIDLTAGYTPVDAVKIHRGFSLLDHRRTVLIQDEIQTKSPIDISWAMHTRAEIKLDGVKAELLAHGKKMHARILSLGEREVRECRNRPKTAAKLHQRHSQTHSSYSRENSRKQGW